MKRDAYLARNDEYFRVTEVMARYVAAQVRTGNPVLRPCFSGQPALIPVPGRAPRFKNSLWVPHVLCSQLGRYLGLPVDEVLARERPVRRSRGARAVDRPSPVDHYRSLSVCSLIPPPGPVILVDDVITRGSTLLGCYARLKDAYPDLEIRCFAMVRTESFSQVEQFFDPRCGVIYYDGGNNVRAT